MVRLSCALVDHSLDAIDHLVLHGLLLLLAAIVVVVVPLHGEPWRLRGIEGLVGRLAMLVEFLS